MIKLCINIDHVATIRQARMTIEPCPVEAAMVAIDGGADGITLHIREDRRHVQDADLFALKKAVSVPLNLEMAATKEMVALAKETKPHMAMIVPEDRAEITTEGGLDVIDNMASLKDVVSTLRDSGIITSAFINANKEQIKATKTCGFTVCEIHTGPYAEAVIANKLLLHHPEVIKQQKIIENAIVFAHGIGLQCNAGHGLTHRNICGIASIDNIAELHIGHSIVSKSVILGMQKSVSKMKDKISNAKREWAKIKEITND